MILIILIFSIIGIGIILKFFKNYYSERNKDIIELEHQSLEVKFSVIIDLINQSAFQGKGIIVDKVPKFFNLYQERSNQLVTFLYGTGHLSIIWRYKYFQKEVVHKRQFNNVRNISVSDQQKIAEMMIKEMISVIEKHKIEVVETL